MNNFEVFRDQDGNGLLPSTEPELVERHSCASDQAPTIEEVRDMLAKLATPTADSDPIIVERS